MLAEEIQPFSLKTNVVILPFFFKIFIQPLYIRYSTYSITFFHSFTKFQCLLTDLRAPRYFFKTSSLILYEKW